MDTGPLVSLLNRSEGERSRLAARIVRESRRYLVVPWPVYVETDLLLRRRNQGSAASSLGTSLLTGEIPLVDVSPVEHAAALQLLTRYADLGIDLPDASVMAMADERKAHVLTWDFRHFRAVVFRRGATIPLLVSEAELP